MDTMNPHPNKYINACKILELPYNREDEWRYIDLKRQYRRFALLYHPDKNRSEDATIKFQEVNNAYAYLMKYQGFEDDEDMIEENDDGQSENNQSADNFHSGYNNILFSFLSPIFGGDLFQDITARLLRTILDKISKKCEEKAFQLLKQLDKRIFHKICEILHKYSDVLHISAEFLEKLDNVYETHCQGDECIILSPFLDDLFEEKLYRLTHNGNTYFIPLWHTELVYDNSGSDLYVQCVPVLQDGVTIDENNNIHTHVEYTIDNIWDKSEVEIVLGKRKFRIMRNQLKITPEQIIVLPKKGISKINTDEIYDVTKKSDLHIHIHLSAC